MKPRGISCASFREVLNHNGELASVVLNTTGAALLLGYVPWMLTTDREALA